MALIHYITQVQFDFGAIAMAGSECRRFGIARPLVCTDRGIVAAGLLPRLTDALGDIAAAVYDGTPANPTEAAVRDAVAAYRQHRADGLIALGGGSSIDLAKGVAIAATHDGPLTHYATIEGGSGRIGSRGLRLGGGRRRHLGLGRRARRLRPADALGGARRRRPLRCRPRLLLFFSGRRRREPLFGPRRRLSSGGFARRGRRALFGVLFRCACRPGCFRLGGDDRFGGGRSPLRGCGLFRRGGFRRPCRLHRRRAGGARQSLFPAGRSGSLRRAFRLPAGSFRLDLFNFFLHSNACTVQKVAGGLDAAACARGCGQPSALVVEDRGRAPVAQLDRATDF